MGAAEASGLPVFSALSPAVRPLDTEADAFPAATPDPDRVRLLAAGRAVPVPPAAPATGALLRAGRLRAWAGAGADGASCTGTDSAAVVAFRLPDTRFRGAAGSAGDVEVVDDAVFRVLAAAADAPLRGRAWLLDALDFRVAAGEGEGPAELVMSAMLSLSWSRARCPARCDHVRPHDREPKPTG
ncbi:hypothetical protein KIH74_01840 [Kineosporia sp. J2-2]|uniref:Uncharacterized protein n=1 Tax=Kineosporia corallincola TaxID=2835133 RepID=A0ABS5T998_9ACTN|nr:hypothetical protein [Kineosporia corallincola]MBT0767647.1 hypothetical protein [Kineosporia corallincola]